MSQAKSSSGRETSFGLPTSGHKGWMPVLLKDGAHSKRPPQEGYKNVLTNAEYIPPGGWNDAPPGPTGEPVRQASDAYRRGYDQIIWDKDQITSNHPKADVVRRILGKALCVREEADHAS